MALREGTYPPGPLSYEERGSKAPLMAYRSGCSDGLTEGIKRLKSLINPLAKPLTVPPFLAGKGE